MDLPGCRVSFVRHSDVTEVSFDVTGVSFGVTEVSLSVTEVSFAAMEVLSIVT